MPTPKDTALAARLLLDDLVAALGDPRSRRFYALCVSRLPEDVVRATLSEVLHLQRCGEIRQSRGALFTGLVKRVAERLGISLARGSAARVKGGAA